MTRPSLALMLLCTLATFLAGCKSPDAANIALRKENQQLRTELEQLRRQHEADVSSMKAMQSSQPPMVSSQQLDGLFTVAGLKLNRLTGGADLDNKPGHDGLKVYAVPTDQAGDALKVAGAFVVEATDPTQSPEPLVGRWEFPAADAAKNWYGQALLSEYVLTCPFPNPPTSDQVRIKVTFTDLLTGRVVGPVEKRVTVELPR